MRALFVPLILAALALSACATGPKTDPDYAAYLRFVEQQNAGEQKRFESIAATAAGCQDDACRTTIAAFAALAQANGRGAPAVQPHRKTYHPAWGLLGTIVPSLANAAVTWHQSDNARDTSLAQYGFLGGVVRDVAQSPALQSPTITVGGDYVPGSQHIGDAIGGDLISGHVGDTIGRDAIGGDQRIGDDIGGNIVGGDDNSDNSGNIGTENRIDSPGPIDESGDRCTGDTCQGSNNPPPDDDDDGGGG